jgi:hypothetical protein
VSDSIWSVELSVLRRPASVFRELSTSTGATGPGRPYRRPLLLAFVLGCFVSFMASGRLTALLIADGAVSFAFVPILEIAALAVVIAGTRARRTTRLSHILDLFFAGNAPWLLWLVAVMAIAAVVPPRRIGTWFTPLVLTAAVPAAWSTYIDFHFFREVTGRSKRGAIRDVVSHRALGWVAAVAYFLGIALWSDTLPGLLKWVTQ